MDVKDVIGCELEDQVNLRPEIDDQPAYDQLFWEFQVSFKNFSDSKVNCSLTHSTYANHLVKVLLAKFSR